MVNAHTLLYEDSADGLHLWGYLNLIVHWAHFFAKVILLAIIYKYCRKTKEAKESPRPEKSDTSGRGLKLNRKALQASLDFYNLEGFDDVSGVDVVVAFKAATALHAGGDFLGLVLAPLQGGE